MVSPLEWMNFQAGDGAEAGVAGSVFQSAILRPPDFFDYRWRIF
jgi:hypothetical protein